jgi:hypothetical protein
MSLGFKAIGDAELLLQLKKACVGSTAALYYMFYLEFLTVCPCSAPSARRKGGAACLV